MDKVSLKIADQNAAIRYLGEVQSRPLDPVHEPIQNLLDEDARRIEIELDPRRKQIRISGDAKPITSRAEAERILQSICSSKKRGKLGEKGIGMLSFVNAGKWMVTKSQRRGKQVWFKLRRDALEQGQVGSITKAPSVLPYAGTQITVGGIPSRYFKSRFSKERVTRGVLRRWGQLMRKGVRFSVNGNTLRFDDEILEGDAYRRQIPVRTSKGTALIGVGLVILKEPSDAACVSVTHKGQANFGIASVPLFDETVFTTGWLHGTISSDMAPINASRTGFAETREFERWQEALVEVHDELEQIVAAKSKAAAEARDQEVIDEFMRHLKKIFADSELSSVTSASGNGDEPGWGEAVGEETTGREGNGGRQEGKPAPGRDVDNTSATGERGRLPTVPHGGFGEFAPSIRVWRGRKAFKINVKHPDYVSALKNPRKRRNYVRELCLQEAYLYSLEGRRRKQMEECSDEFMGYWTMAFVKS